MGAPLLVGAPLMAGAPQAERVILTVQRGSRLGYPVSQKPQLPRQDQRCPAGQRRQPPSGCTRDHRMGCTPPSGAPWARQTMLKSMVRLALFLALDFVPGAPAWLEAFPSCTRGRSAFGRAPCSHNFASTSFFFSGTNPPITRTHPSSRLRVLCPVLQATKLAVCPPPA